MSSNLVELIELEYVKRIFNKEDKTFSCIKESENVNWHMAIGSLFYVIYDDACQARTGETSGFIDRLPSCYHPNHLFHTLLPSVTSMMSEKHNYLATYRAVKLGIQLMERMSAGSISKDELEMQIHSDFLVYNSMLECLLGHYLFIGNI